MMSGVWRSLGTLGLICLLIAGAGGCSRCAEGDGPAETHYRYSVGETQTFRFLLTQGMEMPEAPENPQGIVLRALLMLTPVSVEDTGRATLDLTLRDVSAGLSEGDTLRPLAAFKELEKARYRLVQDRDGRLEQIEQTAALSGGIEVMAQSLIRTLREVFPVLPERLSPGQDWTIASRVKEQIPGVGETPSATTIRYTAQGRERLEGGENPMRLKVAYQFAIGAGADLADAAPSAAGVDNRGTGEGLIWFDDAGGRLLRAAYETRVTVHQAEEREGVVVDNSRTVVSKIEVKAVE